MDVLSDVLRVTRLSGAVFLEAEFSAPWCVSGQVTPADCVPYLSSPRHVIAFHFVTAGSMKLRVDRGSAVEVRAGEVVLLPHNELHFFGSELDLAPVRAGDVVRARENGGLAQIVHGGGGEQTRLVCGYFGCETSFSPLITALPGVLTVDLQSIESGSWIANSFRLAVSEIAAGRLGSGTVVARLSELLSVKAVSQFIESLPDERRGWLAGLRGPQVGRALALLHESPHKEWTAEAIGREVGLSRSAFVQRFTAIVSQPPMQYLALSRMHLAAQRLHDSGRTVAQVAFEIGYDSEAAFSRAFKRQFGAAPATWRRQAHSG